MVNRGVRWQLTAAYTATTSAATILNTSRPRMDLTDELTFGRVPKFTFTTIHATVYSVQGETLFRFVSPPLSSNNIYRTRNKRNSWPFHVFHILLYTFYIVRLQEKLKVVSLFWKMLDMELESDDLKLKCFLIYVQSN